MPAYLGRRGVGGAGSGGGGGSITAMLGAQAFLRRRDAASDTEGVLAYFAQPAAGETAIAALGPAGNEWSVTSRQRDPGTNGVAESIVYASVAFGDSGLQSEINGIPNTWVGTRTTQVPAGSEGIAAGARHVYYRNLKRVINTSHGGHSPPGDLLRYSRFLRTFFGTTSLGRMSIRTSILAPTVPAGLRTMPPS